MAVDRERAKGIGTPWWSRSTNRKEVHSEGPAPCKAEQANVVVEERMPRNTVWYLYRCGCGSARGLFITGESHIAASVSGVGVKMQKALRGTGNRKCLVVHVIDCTAELV